MNGYVVAEGNSYTYLAEDFSFCERARRSGFEVMVDTRVRLSHVGEYEYRWEDAGAKIERYANYRLRLN